MNMINCFIPNKFRSLFFSAGFSLLFIFASEQSKASNIVDIADAYFKAVVVDSSIADNYTSSSFKETVSREEIERFIRQYNIYNYAGASWPYRKVSDKEAMLFGHIYLEDGAKLPMEINFVKEIGKWKIYKITKREISGVLPDDSLEIPGDEELIEMTRNTMIELGLAVLNNNFDNFYASISFAWQAETSPKELSQAFSAFVEKDIDLTNTDSTGIVISKKPIISENGFLEFEVIYPARPQKAHIGLKYIHENMKWELIGIEIDFK